MLRYLYFAPHHGSATRRAYFTTPQPNRLDRVDHHPAHAILLCQCITHIGGTGISTSCPSPTTPVLGLGPDLPWADEPSPGNLGLSTCRFLACISLLIPAFSLLCRPRRLSIPLLPAHYAPLPLAAIYTILVCSPSLNPPSATTPFGGGFAPPPLGGFRPLEWCPQPPLGGGFAFGDIWRIPPIMTVAARLRQGRNPRLPTVPSIL
jgi:hypothetical protein